MIPRIVHHIWLGPDPLPEEHGPWIETWKRHHPDWEFRMWTEENLPEDPIRPEILERLRAPVERADILRLELVYRYGGVYLDTDLECLRPMDDVLAGEDFVGVCHKPGKITNTAIAAAPEHPLLKQALEQVNPMEIYWTGASERLKEVAGGLLLARLIVDFPEIKLLPPPVFFPETPEERENAICIHHLARVWHNTTTLRAAMLRAEARLEKTKEKLAQEERAHAETKKRLAKAEGRRKERRGGKGEAPKKAKQEGTEERRSEKQERREKRGLLRRSG